MTEPQPSTPVTSNADDSQRGLPAQQHSPGGASTNAPSVHTHVYPVDLSMTADEAWRELCIFGQRVTYTGGEKWASLTCDGEECRLLSEDVA